MTFAAWLQSRLTAHGFPVGPIDGDIGDVTIAAIKAFQARERLPVTGTSDPATVAAMRKSASTIAVPLDRQGTADTAVRTVWPRQSAVPAYFGPVGLNQAFVTLPYPMRLAWDKSTTIKRISLHEKAADSAARCFDRIADAYDDATRRNLGLDLFGGSLNVRRMRGGTAYSMHSWGIAIDFDPIRNQLSWGADRARLAKPDAAEFWSIWEAEGWVSLGRERNYDWMHIQAARL